MEAANMFDNSICVGIEADFAKNFIVFSADTIVFNAAWAENNNFTADMAYKSIVEEKVFNNLGLKIEMNEKHCLKAQYKKNDKARKVSRKNMSK